MEESSNNKATTTYTERMIKRDWTILNILNMTVGPVSRDPSAYHAQVQNGCIVSSMCVYISFKLYTSIIELSWFTQQSNRSYHHFTYLTYLRYSPLMHQLAPHISYQVSWLKGLQDQRMSSITWWWLYRFCEGGSQASACKLKTTRHWLGQCVQRICWSRSTSHARSNPQRQGGMWLRGDGWRLVDQEFRPGLCQTKSLAISCGETSDGAKDRHQCHIAR